FPQLRPGLTERRLAAALDARMAGLGAGRPAFRALVASGPDGGGRPHAPSALRSRRGALIPSDFGAVDGGCAADVVRTLAPGEPGVRIEHVLVVGVGGTGLSPGTPILTTNTRALLVLLPGDETWPPRMT